MLPVDGSVLSILKHFIKQNVDSKLPGLVVQVSQLQNNLARPDYNSHQENQQYKRRFLR